MEESYTPVTFEKFIEENKNVLRGECFLIVSAGPSMDTRRICDVNVVGSPMSMEIMRAMIIAAVYHHNVQEDSFDIALVPRDIHTREGNIDE